VRTPVDKSFWFNRLARCTSLQARSRLSEIAGYSKVAESIPDRFLPQRLKPKLIKLNRRHKCLLYPAAGYSNAGIALSMENNQEIKTTR
jgi:hypothetical protein